MWISVRLDKDFQGPSVFEIAEVIRDIEGIPEISWGNSTKELVGLEPLLLMGRDVVLVVKDQNTYLKASYALGLSYAEQVSPDDVKTYKDALAKKGFSGWTEIADRTTRNKVIATMTAIAAESLRSGKTPSKLVSVVSDIVCRGLSIGEAQVLMRLRALRERA